MDRRRRRPKELEEGPFLGLIKREATKSYRSADRSAPLESCVQRVAGVIGAHLGSIPSPRRTEGFTQAPGPVVLVADPRAIGAVKRDVGADLEVDITAQTTLEIQIAVDYAATHGLRLSAAIVDTQR